VETPIELTEAELDEVVGGIPVGGGGGAEARTVTFTATATGPNATVIGSVVLSTSVPTG
jgi:hypothetical protein